MRANRPASATKVWVALIGLLLMSLSAGCSGAGSQPGGTNPAPVTTTPNPDKQPPAPPAGDLKLPARFTAVTFRTATEGWLAGRGDQFPDWRSGTLLHTTDGGKTWSGTEVPGTYFLRLSFVDSQHGWAAGQGGCKETGCDHFAIFATRDGGTTWKEQWQTAIKEPSQSITEYLGPRFFFADANRGFATLEGHTLTTKDGGTTWQEVNFGSQEFIPVSMSFVDARTGWVAGHQGCAPDKKGCRAMIMGTRDGGATWATVLVPDVAGAYLSYSGGVSFVDASHGWFFYKNTDNASFLLRTADGGKKWEQVNTGVADGRTVAGMPAFVTTRTGWLPNSSGAAPFPGAAWITQNGGESWQAVQPLGQQTSITAVSLLSEVDGWAINERGSQQDVLLHTTTGGNSWEQVLPAK